ncbi:hypothetical protein DPEC_G00347300 [Dallia pectoralis]|uniref:Uncharacterized protein n=1 Tax=Dallia pectoralis TaxID=75939 RepID=A0ACC2F4F1_DALPE|nr:hypothetical protein DPEC_G00347300 [Dallia pectoralis]
MVGPHRYVSFLVALVLGISSSQDEIEVVSCPEHQVGFDGSCYEFVVIQRTFLGAQGWCERGGGHLAFILNDETQQFLQKQLHPEKDWWMGLAPASPLNLTLDSAAEGHPLRSADKPNKDITVS